MNYQNRKLRIGFLAAIVLGVATAFNLKVESSDVHFYIKNAGITVDGTFKDRVDATIEFDPNDLSGSSITATIQVKSIETGIGKRDEHLRSEDYFYAEKFPLITMKSTRFAPSKSGDYIGYFDLTIRGKTKNVKVPFKFNRNGNKANFDGWLRINRRDFGVGGSSYILADQLKATIKTETLVQ